VFNINDSTLTDVTEYAVFLSSEVFFYICIIELAAVCQILSAGRVYNVLHSRCLHTYVLDRLCSGGSCEQQTCNEYLILKWSLCILVLEWLIYWILFFFDFGSCGGNVNPHIIKTNIFKESVCRSGFIAINKIRLSPTWAVEEREILIEFQIKTQILSPMAGVLQHILSVLWE